MLQVYKTVFVVVSSSRSCTVFDDDTKVLFRDGRRYGCFIEVYTNEFVYSFDGDMLVDSDGVHFAPFNMCPTIGYRDAHIVSNTL